MGLTTKATIPTDLYQHWISMMESYLSQEITLIEIITTLDDMGQIVGISEDESIIYGAISPVGSKTITEAPGMWIQGDVVMYLMAEDSFESEQTDPYTTVKYYIKYDSKRYKTEKVKTAFDNGAAVVVKYRLVKIEG